MCCFIAQSQEGWEALVRRKHGIGKEIQPQGQEVDRGLQEAEEKGSAEVAMGPSWSLFMDRNTKRLLGTATPGQPRLLS